MVRREDIEEIKRMCTLLFLELQDIRRRLDIESVGQRDAEAFDHSVSSYLKQFDARLRSLGQKASS